MQEGRLMGRGWVISNIDNGVRDRESTMNNCIFYCFVINDVVQNS
jgi:hypothetical protein